MKGSVRQFFDAVAMAQLKGLKTPKPDGGGFKQSQSMTGLKLFCCLLLIFSSSKSHKTSGIDSLSNHESLTLYLRSEIF